MADNIAVLDGTGASVTIGTKDLSGVHLQKATLVDQTGTAVAPLTDTALRATPVPVSGTVTANLGATDNAVLDDIAANQTDASQKTQVVDGSGNVIGSTSNALDVNIKSGGGTGGTASADDADFVAGTTNGTLIQGVYESTASSVTDGDMGAVGITEKRAFKVAAVDSDGAPVYAITEPAHGAADDANGPVKIGGKATAAAPAAVDGDDRVNASFDLQGRLRITQDTGISVFRSIDLDESEEEVKDSGGYVLGFYIFNLHATDLRYVHFYDVDADDVTVGTTASTMTFPLPAKGGATVTFPDGGLSFPTGITIAATTTLAGADAPGANEVIANVFYR